MTPQAWRIYHKDAVSKTELTSSPTRVKKAREAGLTVVPLIEIPLHDCQQGELVNYDLTWITGTTEKSYVTGWATT